MTTLQRKRSLEWTVELAEGGYMVHTLYDQSGQRWGYVINAGSFGVDAHVGSFGQGPPPGLVRGYPLPTDQINLVDNFAEGRAWVEQTIADWWKEQ